MPAYVKRCWNEPLWEHNSRKTFCWHFEVVDKGVILRYVIQNDSDMRLYYGEGNAEDELSGLNEKTLNQSESVYRVI